MGFELFCMTLIALFVGLAICFAGYRWFGNMKFTADTTPTYRL